MKIRAQKKVMGKLEYLRALRAAQTAAHPADLPERFSNPPLNNNNNIKNDNKKALFSFQRSLSSDKPEGWGAANLNHSFFFFLPPK